MTHSTPDDQPSTWTLGDNLAMAQRLPETAAAAAGIRSRHLDRSWP
ncbi:hypothetical protein OHA40_01725 [Nocardia sp. NBC_00508]|nr:hypothetical protein [Nocardia sp. NBC_00508]WUD66916.1 hypothetical protein OHA40_01725 [Nocardia sp. NBC_00508]